MARECVQAWGQPRPPAPVSVVSVRSLLYEFLFWAGFDSTARVAGW